MKASFLTAWGFGALMRLRLRITVTNRQALTLIVGYAYRPCSEAEGEMRGTYKVRFIPRNGGRALVQFFLTQAEALHAFLHPPSDYYPDSFQNKGAD